MNRMLIILLCVILLTACAGGKVESQAADLAFWAKCESRANPEMEHNIETFLVAKGFRVINLGAIQRTKGIHIFDLYIEAMDSSRRVINFVSFPTNPGDYAISLSSEPPTRHDEVLEGAMLHFATEGMGCIAHQITRGDNGMEAKEMHHRGVLRMESLFKEAEELGVFNKPLQPIAPKDGAPVER